MLCCIEEDAGHLHCVLFIHISSSLKQIVIPFFVNECTSNCKATRSEGQHLFGKFSESSSLRKYMRGKRFNIHLTGRLFVEQ